MAEISLPNPGSTTMYFIGITIILIVVTITKINSAKDFNTISARRENNIYNIIYILVVIIGSYFINVTISKAMCNQSIQWGYILLITLLPWIVIFITLYGILYLFPGWITPFSNTIGYLVILAFGVEKIYGNIFKTGDEALENPELVKAIANMSSNKTKFINQISSDLLEFIDFFKNMKDAVKSNIIIPDIPSSSASSDEINSATSGDATSKYSKNYEGGAPGDENKSMLPRTSVSSLFRRRPKDAASGNIIYKTDTTTASDNKETNIDYLLKFYRLLVIKQFIGKMVWYILAGILICSISYNLIINMSCEKSLDELTKEYEAASAEITESRLNIDPPTLATPSGVVLNNSSSADITAGLKQQFGTQ
jgi:hypothetical protein